MNLTYLNSFLVVTRQLSISKAARELMLSQSALSRQISQLEGQVGAKLLVRSNRGIYPTAAGILLRDRGIRLMNSFKELENEVRDLGENGHPLNLGVPPGIPVKWIDEFIAKHFSEGDSIRIHELSSTEQLDYLRQNMLDLALTREMTNEFIQVLAFTQPLGIATPLNDFRASEVGSLSRFQGGVALVNSSPEAKTQIQSIRNYFDKQNLNIEIVLRRFDTHGITIARLEHASFAIVTEETAQRAFPRWGWSTFPESSNWPQSRLWATTVKDADNQLKEMLTRMVEENLFKD